MFRNVFMKSRFSNIFVFLLFLFVFSQFSAGIKNCQKNFYLNGEIRSVIQANSHVQDFYVQKQTEYSNLIKSVNIESKNKNFENSISRQFLSCTKSRLLTFVYSSYENAHFMRLKCLSKFKKAVIKLQTFI